MLRRLKDAIPSNVSPQNLRRLRWAFLLGIVMGVVTRRFGSIGMQNSSVLLFVGLNAAAQTVIILVSKKGRRSADTEKKRAAFQFLTWMEAGGVMFAVAAFTALVL